VITSHFQPAAINKAKLTAIALWAAAIPENHHYLHAKRAAPSGWKILPNFIAV
jgi:hypothetical protein